MPIKDKFKRGKFHLPPTPTTLEEAFDTIDEITNPEERDFVMNHTLERWQTITHHGWGRWIRNHWGLWTEEGPLYEWFVELGLHHADDMSGIILDSYWKHKHGVPLDIEGQVQHYLDYWAKREAETS